MEYTKGKLKHKNGGIIRSKNRNKHIISCISYCSTNPNFSTDAEANAEEIIRRWNAFEEDGFINSLLAPLDRGLAKAKGLAKIAEAMDISKNTPGNQENKKDIEILENAIREIKKQLN